MTKLLPVQCVAMVMVSAVAFSWAIQAAPIKGPFILTAEAMGGGQTEAQATDGAFWTPTTDVALRAIESTKQYVLEHAVEFGYRPPRNHDRRYTHQVFGVVSDSSRNIVVVGICRDAAREMGSTLEKELVSVVDGGDCFFRSEVSLTTMEVVDFRFNAVGG